MSDAIPSSSISDEEFEKMVREGNRIEYSSGSKYEPLAGYTRAIRYRDTITISGTTSTSSPSIESQVREIFKIIENALKALRGSMRDIIRVRMFLKDEHDFEKAVLVHGEIFRKAGIRPTNTTMCGIKLADEGMKVEIEVDAIAGCGDGKLVRII